MAKNGKGKATAQAITPEFLLSKIDAVSAENRRLTSANLALMSQAPVVASVAPPKDINLDNLPDPAAEPAKYAAELAKRVSAHTAATVNYASQTQNATQTRKQRTESLFSDFNTQFPELAKNRDRLEFVAQKVVARAQAAGIDAEKYMFTAKDQFFADINAEYAKVFAPVAAPNVDPTDTEPTIDNADPVALAEAPGKPGQAVLESDDDEDDGRSAGIFGGQESGTRASAAKADPAEIAAREKQGIKPGDLIDDLQTMQKRSGFF